MKNILLLVSLVITVSSVACPQSHRVAQPQFCARTTFPSTGICEFDVLHEYFDQLKQSLNVLAPGLIFPPLPLPPPVPERNPELHAEKPQWTQPQRSYEENLESIIVNEHVVLNGAADPLPIEGENVYLNENQQNMYGDFQKEEGTDVASLAKSVGRLEIRYSADTTKGHETKYFQWGTGFLVGKGVIVTTCHVLESLLVKENGQWRLQEKELKDHGETLLVDFGDKDDHFEPTQEYEVGLLALADTQGLDIALLKIKDDGTHPNPRKGLKFRRARLHPPEPKLEVVVVGYPDFHHPLDPHAEAAYEPYKTQGDAKFALLGCAVDSASIQSCASEKPVFLHTSPTTMGESGSILIDRKSKQVIGIHTCCSYPEKDDDTAPESELDCAKLKRTEVNQAIEICSIFQDPSLNKKLGENGITADNSGCGGQHQ
jgi:hypothetical protein